MVQFVINIVARDGEIFDERSLVEERLHQRDEFFSSLHFLSVFQEHVGLDEADFNFLLSEVELLLYFLVGLIGKFVDALVEFEQFFILTHFIEIFEEDCHFRDANFTDEGFKVFMLFVIANAGVAAVLDGVLRVAKFFLVDFVELDEFIERSLHDELETLNHGVFLDIAAERGEAVYEFDEEVAE